MDISSVFDISAAGMNLQRTRLEVSAINLANADTTRGPDGLPFTPLQVVAHASVSSFDALVQASRDGLPPTGLLPVAEVRAAAGPPRQVYDPSHPDANAQGYVSYPDINPVSEMVQLITITRAYEANVRALNAAHSMALKALEIGSGR
jgi:flagellar basal-body rod protein FlgC